MIIFIAVTSVVIFLGVNKGIESFSKILMPILIILVIGISIFALTISYTDAEGVTRTGWEGFKIYVIPNFEGMTVKGIVRDTEKNKNGIFIELTPNLVGMTEYTKELQYGQTVDVCIKKIVPEKKKVKLVIV